MITKQENFNESEFIKNIKYGLIVVEKEESKRFDGDNILFYHFCGYANKPDQSDIDSLRAELCTDDMKLENIDNLDIIEAPDYVLEYFIKDIQKNKNN
jgi:hypothetical protein